METKTNQPFKLLGIRPLTGCSDNVLKNLIENECYILDSSYEFDEEKCRLIKKKNSVTLPNDFYLDKLNLSITAIVGENGSGKTALINLVNRSLMVILLHSKNYNLPQKNNFNNEDINCEIYFLLNDKVNCLQIINDDIKFREAEKQFETITPDFLLDNEKLYWFLHYINYSPFTLLEDITYEFFGHKNNQYQDNLLVTPKRENSVINIKNEIEINQSNFLYCLSYFNPLNIDKIEYKLKTTDLHKIEITSNTDDSNFNCDFQYIINDELDEKSIIKNYVSICECIFKDNKQIEKKSISDLITTYVEYTINGTSLNISIIKGYCLIYLVNKLMKYSNVVDKHQKEFPYKYIYISSIYNNPSHLTFKIFQTINFFSGSSFFTKIIINDNSFSLDIDVFKEIIDEKNSKNVTPEFFIPISGFEINLFSQSINISAHSSGQIQLISTVSNILINLIRMNSRTYEYFIANDVDDNASGTFFYNNVIILDEIEINLHPQYQREFISKLVSALKSINFYLKNIHIILLTHSPFILSDIPSQNVLKLKNGVVQPNDENDNSFAANIHDLLNDDFFMENGTMGKFAKDKIHTIIKKTTVEMDDLKVIDLIGDPFLKGVILSKVREKLSKEAINKEIERLQKLKASIK